MIHKIPISNKPSVITITVFKNDYYQYWLNNLNTKNKNCDIGCWRIKYKL